LFSDAKLRLLNETAKQFVLNNVKLIEKIPKIFYGISHNITQKLIVNFTGDFPWKPWR